MSASPVSAASTESAAPSVAAPASASVIDPGIARGKYQPFPPVALPDRQWPGRTVTTAPLWCSVDLRDGNQALIEPMGTDRKRRMFELLVRMGFKEIEVGFPAASQTDFDFLRALVDENLIPDDVTIQVLTQAREDLIRRTFEAIQGTRQAIVHLYNSTSELQRRVVFNMDRPGIIDLAVKGTQLIKALTATLPDCRITLQYSPESFTGTELDFAVEICDAVMRTWEPTPENKVILNLPATVEMASPNVHADQIEWFCRHLPQRDRAIISLHPHNDRGTAVAAAELGMLAGADRVEGTLFGNGERTGNVDIVTLALNLYTQGVDPRLSLRDINDLVRTVEYCNQLPVHPRHPYAGELVFTAFSGSHQDAIRKGFAALATSNSGQWEVPYLPIDPKDIGRSYEAVIRINSQSGKGGIAYVLENDYGIHLPRRLQIEFSKVVQTLADASGKEVSPEGIWAAFSKEYLERESPITLRDHATTRETSGSGKRVLNAVVDNNGQTLSIQGSGKGPIDAFVNALQTHCGVNLTVVDYREQAVQAGADAPAIAFVEVKAGDGHTLFGVGMHDDILTASLRAVLSAANRFLNGA